MDATSVAGSAPPLPVEAGSDLKALLRTVRFPISRAELRGLAARAGLSRDSVAALGSLTEPTYTGSFAVLRELRHHGELRGSA